MSDNGIHTSNVLLDNGFRGNPHARDVVDSSWGTTKTDAVLALAWEQRTANLLALMAQTGSVTLRASYRTEVLERMGMETGE